jgi:hypothetical protein
MRPLFSILFTAISCLAGCAEVDSFSQLESEILVPSCGFSSCHGSNAGGLQIEPNESYDALVGVPSVVDPDLILVKPGDPEASYLMAKLEGRAEWGDPMPVGVNLLDSEILDRIRAWIEAGAEE